MAVFFCCCSAGDVSTTDAGEDAAVDAADGFPDASDQPADPGADPGDAGSEGDGDLEPADGDAAGDGDVQAPDDGLADGDGGEEPLEVFFAETFEAWEPGAMSGDSMIAAWQSVGPNWSPGQTIVDLGGEHGMVWQSTVYQDENMGFERIVLLGRPFDELWFSSDLYADPDFNHISNAGNYSGKMLFGFMGGGEIIGGTWEEDQSPTGNAWWAHGVWGSAGSLMPYIYDQLVPGRAIGEQANIPIPRGYWVNITRRARLNTPGVADGLFEVYADGELVIQVTDIMMRSAAQGPDYGKIEGIKMSYFFGGSGPDFASPRDNFIRIDNLVAYRYSPASQHYLDGPAPPGHTIPIVRPGSSRPVEDIILTDDHFGDPAGIIYCTGNRLLTIPPASKTPVFLEITFPAGYIGLNFSKFEPGYNYSGANNMYVSVYQGLDDAKTLLWTFGRPDAGYTLPSGDYSVPGGQATIEFHSGNQWGRRRGWTLDYWQE